MRKSYLFAAAGAAVFLCGCPTTTPVAGTKPVIPAPMQDPVNVAPEVVAVPDGAGWQAPENRKTDKPVPPQPEFQPLTGVTSSGGIESNAADIKRSKKSAKYGKTAAAGGVYTVQSGDTPERIARKHRVRLSALMAINNLDQQSARRLQIGQKLTIPGKDAKVAVRTKSAKTAKAAPAALDSEGKYTVQSGDTPERIARKHRVRLSELLKANNLDQQSARRLQIGQKLIIPGKNAPVVTPPENDKPIVEDIPDVTKPPVVEPVKEEKATKVPETGNVVENTDVNTATSAGADADSELQVVEITAPTTAAELAVKYNVSAEVISQKNSGKTEFPQGELIFVPKK